MNRSTRPLTARRVTAILAVAALAALGAVALVVHAKLQGVLSWKHAAIDLHHAAFDGLTVTLNGRDPVFTADRLDIGYDLRDLAVGSRRAFGLVSIVADRPRITLVRYPDGTWNAPIGSTPGGGQTPSVGPYRFDARILDGSIGVRDETRVKGAARDLEIDGIHVDAHVDQTARSTYRVDAALVDGKDRYPVVGRGLLDDRIGYEINRWTARSLPLSPLAEYALDTRQISVASGFLKAIDVRYYGLAARDGAIDRHLAGSAYLDGLRVYVKNVKAPLRDGHGAVYAFDDGIALPRADATIAGIPLLITGGAFGLKAPELRFGIRARGSLARAGELSPALAGKGIAGNVDLDVLAEGPAKAPLVFARADARSLRYGTVPVEDVRALAAVDGTDAELLDGHARYGPLALSARGHALLDDPRAGAEGVVRIDGRLAQLPYAAALAGDMKIDAIAAASGRADAFSAGGVVDGTGPGERLSGTLRFAPNGTGTIGPLLFVRSDGSSLFARIAVDRTAGEATALLDADRLHVDTRRIAPSFPGMQLAALPPVSATLSANVGAVVRRTSIASSGFVTTHAAVSGGELVALGSFSTATSLADLRARAGLALTRARYRDRRLDAASGLRFADGRLTFDGASASWGGALATLDGSVGGLDAGKAPVPRYDLRARLFGAPLGLAAALAGRRLPYPRGQIDADVRVGGAGRAPSVAGRVAVPEGSVNGLAFTAGADIDGTPQRLAARNGDLTVGSTRITFAGAYDAGTASATLRAPHADLADFNEYFDVADTLGGRGSLTLSFSAGPDELATDGDVALTDVRFRRYEVGTTAARWATRGRTVSAQASVLGAGGRLALGGDVAVPASDPLRDTLRRSQLDLSASARDVDLSRYLSLAGIRAPVTGTVDADAAVHGTYPGLTATAHANVAGGAIGRLPIRRFDASLSASAGRARIESAELLLPHLSVEATGDAGLRPDDGINVTAHVASDDVGALYDAAMSRSYDVAGALDATLRIGGTLRAPAVAGTLALDRLKYDAFTVPHAGAQIVATKTRGTLQNGEIDFTRGKLLASGTLPLAQAPGPFSLALRAEDVDLAPFGALFPKGTKLAGTLAGTVAANGTTADPAMEGSLALTSGAFSSPAFQAPLTDLTTTVAFSGHRISIPDASAKIGGGTITASGAATVPNFRTPARDLAFRFDARTSGAGFDVPAYFRGTVDADVTATRVADAPIRVGGHVAISRARIPVNALYNPAAPKSASLPALPLAFDGLGISVGQDVRVQSSVIDVGATGALTIGGTLAQPALDGDFTATGGTVDVYHDFHVVNGRIAFRPDQGLMPNVDTVATTTIDNPPTDITLHITGTVPDLNLGLSSDPRYSRAQILGLLLGVQALGAVQGLPQTGGSTQALDATTLAENEAEGVLETQLTRGIFEPLQSGLGNALGANVQLYLDPSSGFAAHESRGLGKDVSAVFGQSFGPVQKQVFGLRATPNPAFSLQLTYYEQEGALGFAADNSSYLQSLSTGTINQELTAETPTSGTNGYSFAVQRRYP